MIYHLHICQKCSNKWADNMVAGKQDVCPHCGTIQPVEDRGELDEKACLLFKVLYRRINIK